MIVILGNMAFHHFSEEELALFKTDKERKAIVYSISSVQFAETEDEAEELGEQGLDKAESYLVPSSFDGEIVYVGCEEPQEIVDK
jgi:hypothetical protein